MKKTRKSSRSTTSLPQPRLTPNGMAWPLLVRGLVEDRGLSHERAHQVCTLLEMSFPYMWRLVQELQAGLASDQDRLLEAAVGLAYAIPDQVAAVGVIISGNRVEDTFDTWALAEAKKIRKKSKKRPASTGKRPG
jgi:hypothetical protein